MARRAHVLVVDDEAVMRDGCRQILERMDLHVSEAVSSAEALAMLDAQAFGLVLLDLKMPGEEGMEVLRRIRAAHRRTAVVVITGYASVETAVAAMKGGAVDVLPKPFSAESLRAVVERSLDYERLEREAHWLRNELRKAAPATTMVGRAPRMKRVFQLIERVAPTDSTVLVTGESGTGKELVARALHAGSHRAARPFMVVDCATLVGTLFENELFGHAKGSYTGATSTTHGRFELADGGTIFLDEVGCMDPGMQQKLLRVLEQREITRVGSSQVIPVDVRVIAATNMDLGEAARTGRFRQDLYYRLSVFPIALPLLRHRRPDIPRLAEHFLRLHDERRRKDVKSISPEAMAILMAQDWPGNVRELSNAIERAVVLAEGDELLPEHLLHYGRMRMPSESTGTGRPMRLADLEREHVQHVLRSTGGNRSLAAELLGIDRKTLWRKLRAYGPTAGP